MDITDFQVADYRLSEENGEIFIVIAPQQQ